MNENKCNGCDILPACQLNPKNPHYQPCPHHAKPLQDENEAEIIVKEIDVTECEFYDKNYRRQCALSYLDGYDSNCLSNIHCIYKQLQQKEQEYSHLLETHTLSMDMRKSHIKQLEEMCEAKDAEIEELKAEINEYHILAKETISAQKMGVEAIENLQSKLNKAIEGLEEICSPLLYLKKRAEINGAMLNGNAVIAAKDLELLKRIATQTLEEIKGKEDD